jgi:signal transduction histidine kinase
MAKDTSASRNLEKKHIESLTNQLDEKVSELEQTNGRLALLSRQLLAVQETERRHLARELHDEFGQILTVIGINLHTIKGSASAAAKPSLDDCISLVDEAIQHVRNLALELRPSILDDFGLSPALRWYCARQAVRTGHAVHFVARTISDRFAPEIETACFRIAQEALTNVMRHARTEQMWVELRQNVAGLRLVVRDDGAGFDVNAMRQRAAHGQSMGLLGMDERALLLGGRLEIKSTPGKGTTVEARFPPKEEFTP